MPANAEPCAIALATLTSADLLVRRRNSSCRFSTRSAASNGIETANAMTHTCAGRSSEVSVRKGWTTTRPARRQPAVDQVGLTDPFLLGGRVGGGVLGFLPDAFGLGFHPMGLSQEVLVLVHALILPETVVCQDRRVAGLRELWNDVVPDAGALADDLVGRYAGKDRHAYRDRYVVTVLIAMASLDQLCTDPTAVRLAAWFHRAVHAPGSTAGADAEASAQLAEEVLPGYGVSHARTAEVARLVRLTGGAESPKAQDPNADVLLDAVNAILADNGYPIHAADVRRDAEDESFAETARRYAEIRGLLNSRIVSGTELALYRSFAAAGASEKPDGPSGRSWGAQLLGRAGVAGSGSFWVVTAAATAFVAFVNSLGGDEGPLARPGATAETLAGLRPS